MIVTFYSYKGGVGRTQLLSNLASYLCYYKNRKVLVIDWDFEAPGLDVFFDVNRAEIQQGILDLFVEFKAKVGANENLREEDLPKISQEYLINCIESADGGRVDLLPASSYDKDYSSKINQFDWFEFYDTLHGKYYIEFLKCLLREPKAFESDIEEYDYIFIDSRTGVSDYSGICNIHLPDLNVFVIAPTLQNFDGCKRIYTNILNAPYVEKGNREPIIMPVLSRLVEGDNTESGFWIGKFRDTFKQEICKFIKYSLHERVTMDMISEEVVNEFIDKTLLPHKNELAYGETILFEESKKSIESTTIEKQFLEIARFLEDFSRDERKEKKRQKLTALEPKSEEAIEKGLPGSDPAPTERAAQQRWRYQGSGDNVAGDKIILTSVKSIPRDLSPLPSNQLFIGRKPELDYIQQFLGKEKKFFSITGLAGIGKTSLAQEYMDVYRDDFNFRLWVSIKTDLQSALIYNTPLIDSLDLQNELQSSSLNNEDKFEIILNNLRKLNGKNLLVIDNLEEDARILKSINLGDNWSVIITSRIASAELRNLGPQLALGHISEEEGVALFYEYYSKDKNDELVKQLLHFIDYHTLGIEIIAKTAERGRIKLPKLLEIVESGLLKSEMSTSISVTSQNQNLSISSFLTEIIDAVTFSDFELKILKGFSFLEPGFFHYDALLEIFGVLEEEEFKFSETLNLLTEKGFLLEAEETFKCHRIVREIVKNKFTISFEDIAAIVAYYHGEKFGEEPSFGNYSALGTALDDLGDYKEAKRLLEKAMNAAEQKLGANHPTTAVSYSSLALVLQKLGDLQGAKRLLEKAKEVTVQNFGEEDPATTDVNTNLAMVLQDLDDYQGAKDLLEKVLVSTEKNFGTAHPSTALAYSNLALVLQDLGDYEKAKYLLEKTLEIDEENFGTDHPTTALCYSNLALVMQDLGDYEEARILLEKAIQANEKSLGEDHPTTAVRYSNLATVLQDLGEYEEARILLEKAMRSDEKNFGESHPTTAHRYSNLALVLQDLGDYSRAKELLEKTLKSDIKNFGKAHSNTALTYSNLATVLKDLADFKGAKELLKKAIVSNEVNFGESHPTTAVSYSNLALVLHDLGEFEEAKDLLEKAYEAFSKNLGIDHPNTEIVKGNLDFVKSLI